MGLEFQNELMSLLLFSTSYQYPNHTLKLEWGNICYCHFICFLNKELNIPNSQWPLQKSPQIRIHLEGASRASRELYQWAYQSHHLESNCEFWSQTALYSIFIPQLRNRKIIDYRLSLRWRSAISRISYFQIRGGENQVSRRRILPDSCSCSCSFLFNIWVWETTQLKRNRASPEWCGPVGWVSSCKPKDFQFDSQSGHMPGLRVGSPLGGAWEANTHWCFSPSLSLFPSF